VLSFLVIAANPIPYVYPEKRRVYPAGTELGRSDRSASARSWARSVILSAAKDPGLIASASVSELCVLCVSVFGSPNIGALDAASSLSPLSATLTKSTGGGDIPKRRQGTRIAFPLPSTLRIQLSTVFLLTALASALAKNSPATPLQ
jgi:hypothetical protein